MCCFTRFAKALEELHSTGRPASKPLYHVDGVCYNGDKGEEGEV